MAREPAPADWPPISLDDRLDLEIRAMHALIDQLRADHNELAARVAEIERSRGLTEEN